MSYKIKFSKQASDDLQFIYDYHNNNLMVSEQADRIIKNIKEAIKSLRIFPFRHRRVKDPEIADSVPPYIELRSVVKDGYRIFYCVRSVESEIIILTILRNTENIEKALMD